MALVYIFMGIWESANCNATVLEYLGQLPLCGLHLTEGDFGAESHGVGLPELAFYVTQQIRK